MNVTIPFDGDFDALRAKLAAWGFEVGERPNAPLFARGQGVTIHAYRTGKLLINGARAQEWARELRAEVAPRDAANAANAAKATRVAGAAQDAQKAHVAQAAQKAHVAQAAQKARVAQRTQAANAAPAAPEGWLLHFDGLCEPGNPGGVAAYGFQVLRDGRVVHEGSGLAAPPGPGATNNVAEFRALLEGLRWLKANGARRPLVRGDSRLVVETMVGRWQLRAAHLVPMRDEARAILRELDGRIEWVPRDQNGEADRLSRVGKADAVRAHPEWGLK